MHAAHVVWVGSSYLGRAEGDGRWAGQEHEAMMLMGVEGLQRHELCEAATAAASAAALLHHAFTMYTTATALNVGLV